MGELQDGLTIAELFGSAVASHGDRPFFAVPANDKRDYLPGGFEISYRDADRLIAEFSAAYRSAGFGLGHRVATLLENRPEYVLHKFALNGVGACCVPINPDYRAGETAYLLEHSEPDLILALAAREAQIGEALAQSTHKAPVVTVDGLAPVPLAKALRPARGRAPGPGTPSSVEETALAIEILCADPASHPAALRGLTWLMERVEDGTWREPAPIGFYFAKLWYFERLYPLIFTVAALRAARSLISTRPGEAQPSPTSPD